ncbi:lipoate--protein ligase family protein [Candidatus Woesearchaeota archaeon]|nr:lipoate--protein ligase family protein [Candidatus Woesearchaeota archaeon]
MKRFRLLLTGHNSGAMNMAIDEAVMTHISEGKVLPTIRLYGWRPSAITIGYFQSMREEVDLEKCRELGIDFIRRITGGGAVFHENEATYSIIAPENYFSEEILESYKQICSGITTGLKKLGLEAAFAPLNDIVVKGKKVSGNAQTRRMNCILQHGTVLIDVDVKKMFSLLIVPDEKIRSKMINNVEERVTGINKETGRNHGFQEVVNALTDGFREALNLELCSGELSPSEKEMAERLAKEKYSKDEWKFKR